MNTEWPRFEVFEQDGPDQPHHHVGPIQAADGEAALAAARAACAGRSGCTGVWVVPQSQVYGWTSASLRADPSWQTETIVLARQASPYEVFVRQGADPTGSSITHIGTVAARSPAEALRAAYAQFNTSAIEGWWLIQARAILPAVR